jgi:hypothetical protein
LIWPITRESVDYQVAIKCVELILYLLKALHLSVKSGDWHSIPSNA